MVRMAHLYMHLRRPKGEDGLSWHKHTWRLAQTRLGRHFRPTTSRPLRNCSGVALRVLFHGPRDFCRRFAACMPRLRWVLAHLDAPGGGVSEAEWRGNRVADEAARAAAASARLPAVVRERRAAALWHLRALRDVLRVESAVSVAARGQPHHGSGRRRRHPHTHQCGTIT